MLRESRPIYYAAVAGDILGTYRRWREGRRDERQTAMTYSGQFFDLCALTGRRGVASFPSPEMQYLADERFVVRSRPPVRVSKGIVYLLDQFRRATWLFRDVVRSRASDVIVMDGVTFPFLLAPLAWIGRRVFLSIHTVPGTEREADGWPKRVIRRLDSWFLQHYCAGCLAASPTIADQLRSLAGKQDPEIVVFNPLYERQDFERFAPPDPMVRPFRILYAGRIEANKGVFDLLANLRELAAGGRDVRLDYCGDGSALAALRQAIAEARLADCVWTHGHLSRPALLDLLDRAHVLVVPTQSSFPEGLNQVVIEAVLARRPVVTSTVCPALLLIAPAAVEARADDPQSYRDAIARLMDDSTLFAEKVAAGGAVRDEFFDPDRAWTARAIGMMKNGALSQGASQS